MIKINLYCVGSLKEKYLKEAISEYTKRLSRYAKVEIIEVKEAKVDEINIFKGLKEEGNLILNKLHKDDYVILSDLHGEMTTSEEFSELLLSLIDKGVNPLNFVIGGTYGIDEDLRNRSNKKICLSKMTFTHQMTRVILLEQIYRAFKIMRNENYHH